jgi:quercetin dioxygenase-like cupin family protein
LAGGSQWIQVMETNPTMNVLKSEPSPARPGKGELPPARPVRLAEEVAYVAGSIVSRTLAKAQGGSLTLFAFDAGQELSEHTSPFDAFVTVLDGRAELTIGGERVTAAAGETVLMPSGIPHALRAVERFKMLLSMVRG